MALFTFTENRESATNSRAVDPLYTIAEAEALQHCAIVSPHDSPSISTCWTLHSKSASTAEISYANPSHTQLYHLSAHCQRSDPGFQLLDQHGSPH